MCVCVCVCVCVCTPSHSILVAQFLAIAFLLPRLWSLLRLGSTAILSRLRSTAFLPRLGSLALDAGTRIKVVVW